MSQQVVPPIQLVSSEGGGVGEGQQLRITDVAARGRGVRSGCSLRRKRGGRLGRGPRGLGDPHVSLIL